MTVQAATEAPLDIALGVIAPIDLTRFFKGLGPLPAVAAVREQTGGWDEAGQSRLLDLGDGTTAREQLTTYEPPHHFAYRVSGFSGALRFLITHVDGAWWFESLDPAHTHVRWTYAFVPKPGRWIAVRLLIAPLWRVYARRTLALVVAEVQRRARSDP